jgi:Thioesterase-like superfamily
VGVGGMAVVRLDDAWSITGHLNGGYLASVVGQAASDALDGAEPLTISTHYLHPARGAGPADVDVDVVRRGRLSTARVTLSRDGLALVDGFVTVGRPKDAPRVHDRALPPELPPFEECESAGGDGPVAGMELLHTLDVRLEPSIALALTGGPPRDDLRVYGYVTYRDGRPVDRQLVCAAWDVMPPSTWSAHAWGLTPTVSAQVVCYPGEVTAPLIVDARCDTLRDGIIDETSRVWSADGRLVSSARQTALFVPA